jgi:undecaprenyl pyrophosphate phosphatase UppP
MINAAIVSILIYYRRELVSFLSSARTIAAEPAVLLTLLITISYVIYAIYGQDPQLTQT